MTEKAMDKGKYCKQNSWDFFVKKRQFEQKVAKYYAFCKRQTAWADMPSPRPVNPSFSSVVALMLISSISICNTEAMFSRMAER
jgi:hypothetical protein